jgi:hypothetical protein
MKTERIMLAIVAFIILVGLAFFSPAKADEACDVQQELTKRGHFDGPINCKLGPMTKQAIEDFQREQGLHVDGVVGEDTYKALFGRFRRERVEEDRDEDYKAPRVRRAQQKTDQEYFAEGRCADEIVEVTRRGAWPARGKKFAIAGWEDTVDAREDYGRSYSKWENAADASVDCRSVRVLKIVSCVARARPCRTGN